MKIKVVLMTSFLFLVLFCTAYAQTWTYVSPPCDVANQEATSMAVYGGNLYVGTFNGQGMHVWEYNGATWTNVSPPAWAAANIEAPLHVQFKPGRTERHPPALDHKAGPHVQRTAQ